MLPLLSAACLPTLLQLYHAKANAYFGETHDKLSRLLRLTIQTGFLTSMLAVPMTPLYFYGGPGTYTVTYVSRACSPSAFSYLLTGGFPSANRTYQIDHGTTLKADWLLITIRYLISLLANLNARSHQPDLTVAKDITPALSNVEFSPNQNPASGETNVPSNDVLAFVRSIVRSVHDGLTSTGSTQERASVDDAQGHQGGDTAGNSITTQSHDSKEQ